MQKPLFADKCGKCIDNKMERAAFAERITDAMMLGITAALPNASRAMAASIADEAERETFIAECAIVGVLVDKSLPLVELRARRDAAMRGAT